MESLGPERQPGSNKKQKEEAAVCFAGMCETIGVFGKGEKFFIPR
jgi:hypothetical protein